MSTERGLLIKMADLSPCVSHVTYVHIIKYTGIPYYKCLLNNRAQEN